MDKATTRLRAALSAVQLRDLDETAWFPVLGSRGGMYLVHYRGMCWQVPSARWAGAGSCRFCCIAWQDRLIPDPPGEDLALALALLLATDEARFHTIARSGYWQQTKRSLFQLPPTGLDRDV
jgi:hypothetical protein